MKWQRAIILNVLLSLTWKTHTSVEAPQKYIEAWVMGTTCLLPTANRTGKFGKNVQLLVSGRTMSNLKTENGTFPRHRASHSSLSSFNWLVCFAGQYGSTSKTSAHSHCITCPHSKWNHPVDGSSEPRQFWSEQTIVHPVPDALFFSSASALQMLHVCVAPIDMPAVRDDFKNVVKFLGLEAIFFPLEELCCEDESKLFACHTEIISNGNRNQNRGESWRRLQYTGWKNSCLARVICLSVRCFQPISCVFFSSSLLVFGLSLKIEQITATIILYMHQESYIFPQHSPHTKSSSTIITQKSTTNKRSCENTVSSALILQ